MKKSIFIYLCILFVSIKTHEGIKIFINTFIEYSKISDKLGSQIEIPDKCFSEELDSQIQIMVMYFKKKKTNKTTETLLVLGAKYLTCFMEFGKILNVVKKIDFSDVIVIGIRLLGILDDIEKDIINEYHNEDSDYYSLGKTLGKIFNKLFYVLQKKEEEKK